MTEDKKNRCRKCNAETSPFDDYCSNCGAALKVSTNLVKAQPKAALPVKNRFELLWVLIGALVMLGTVSLATTLVILMEIYFFSGNDVSSFTEFKNLATRFIMTLGLMTCLGFGTGGGMMSLISGKRKIKEALTSSFIVALLAGFAGTSLSQDFLLGLLVITIPGALCAAAGAWLGARRADED